MEDSYEFDPCVLDNSDEDGITIDNWKPKLKTEKIIPSEWRKKQIGSNFNQQPGIDELNKIHMYLKKKAPDSEIMNAFGISAEMLIAIKKNKYCPIDGISLDNLSKIYNEFKKIESSIEQLKNATTYVSKTLFITKEEELAYKNYVKKGEKSINKNKNKKVDESEINVQDN